jgi:hypothetical protein
MLTRVRPATVAWPVLIAVVALVVGWVASEVAHAPSDRPGASQMSVMRQIVGTVSSVTYDGSGFCIRADSDGSNNCSQPMQVPGTPQLKVGDNVVVIDAFVGLGNGSSVEVYVVTSPAPPHG